MMKELFLISFITVLGFAGVTKSGDIVTDNDTKLIWQDDNDIKSLKWEESINYCENLALGGYSDWRLPNKNELLSIVDLNKYNPAIKDGFKNTKNSRYWSSSSFAGNSGYAWHVNFDSGYTYGNYKTDSCYVRCVR